MGLCSSYQVKTGMVSGLNTLFYGEKESPISPGASLRSQDHVLHSKCLTHNGASQMKPYLLGNSFCLFGVFFGGQCKILSPCVVLAVLEFTMLTRLASNSEIHLPMSFQNAGITAVCPCARVPLCPAFCGILIRRPLKKKRSTLLIADMG